MNERWREIVKEFETWYFGVPFKDWKENTEVGEWRDIVNAAARYIETLERERDALAKKYAKARKVILGFSYTNYEVRERDELRAALYDMLSSGEEPCNLVHHPKQDRHSVGEPCPVLARYRALLGEEAT